MRLMARHYTKFRWAFLDPLDGFWTVVFIYWMAFLIEN
jgi:hypothetical protein